jgi:hypothetical protein
MEALEEERIAIHQAPFGQQEVTLNNAALKIGGLAAAGELLESYALSELIAAGNAMPSESGRQPWRAAEIERKVRRAFEDGKRTPRNVPPPSFAKAQSQQHRDAGDATEPPPTGDNTYSYIWRSKDYDFPCTPTGEEQTYPADGKVYAKIKMLDGSEGFVLKDQLFPARGSNGTAEKENGEPPAADDPESIEEQRQGDGQPGAGKTNDQGPSQPGPSTQQQSGWPEPDMAVLRLQRREAPKLPIEIFGERWARWIEGAAEASACPIDYVAAPLLAAASAMIGHARWPRAGENWTEPPHLWCASVGDSGDGKSPGADVLYRHIMPEMERKMTVDFPGRLREAQAAIEIAEAKHDNWKSEVRGAIKAGSTPSQPPPPVPEEPVAPRLVLSDATIERVAVLLARAAPKGVLMTRDELTGWLLGMTAYNDGARAFWIEAYGGRLYRVDRVKHPEPIVVPRLAVSWHGGIQPERLAQVMREADDGLLARFMWFWPEPVPFRIADQPPGVDWAAICFDRLRTLDLAASDNGPRPLMVPLTAGAVARLERFGLLLQKEKEAAAGLMRSAIGKARGLTLRLSHVLEHLYWCANDGCPSSPDVIKEETLLAAAKFVAEYAMPMCERTYGDAACTELDRITATLARWIKKETPDEIHVRDMQRKVRLPGLTTAGAIHAACEALIEAGWLGQPAGETGFQQRRAKSYPVSPRLLEILSQ